jgi:2-dehydro-3-deoxygluconokinase
MHMIAMGECMIEVSGQFGADAHLGFAGDSFNTALYLARLGGDVSYATALGDDVWSAQMRAAWDAEGLGTDHVLSVPGKLPGLYAITTDNTGERSFSYWRKDSAVRQFFSAPGTDEALHAIATCDLFYCSGITLSLFDAAARVRLFDAAAQAKANGATVAFDPNYRPAGWASAYEARAAIMDFAPAVSLALPTFDDEHMLFGDADPAATIDRWAAAGIAEIVVKCGTDDVHYAASDARGTMPVNAVPALDTTGAGDSFNAGYLSARMRGHDTRQAIQLGAALSAHVVQYPGGITPRTAFDLFMKDHAP